MTTAYVPYSRTAPKTTHLPTLKAELDRVRSEYGVASSQGLEAYLRYSHAAASQGRPLDALRTYVEDEEERFFSQTIAGADGHTYWDGARAGFRRNDDATRLPIRWWWEHRHGPISQYDQIVATCGERNCITVGHAEFIPREETRGRISDTSILGALQARALEVGHTPTSAEWRERCWSPSAKIIFKRFGSWENAWRSAGLIAPVWKKPQRMGAADCLAAVRMARKLIGHWPNSKEWRRRKDIRDQLRAAGLPSTEVTLYAHLGGPWSEILRRAGKR